MQPVLVSCVPLGELLHNGDHHYQQFTVRCDSLPANISSPTHRVCLFFGDSACCCSCCCCTVNLPYGACCSPSRKIVCQAVCKLVSNKWPQMTLPERVSACLSPVASCCCCQHYLPLTPRCAFGLRINTHTLLHCFLCNL